MTANVPDSGPEEPRGYQPSSDEELFDVLGPAEGANRTTLKFARPIVDRLCDVLPEKVEWMEPGFLPYGKLVLLEGDPGVNKSTLALYIAAQLTRGLPIFGSGAPRQPKNVLLISFEDGVADTIRPRFDAQGGDPTRVLFFRGVPISADEERQPILPDDISSIKEIILENEISLVVVDPLGAALSEKTDTHKDASVRRVTAILAKLAEETGVCILAIRHLVKGAASNAMRAGGGSIAFIAAARVAMVVHLHPEDSEKPHHERRRVLACVKNNLAPHPASRLFQLDKPDAEIGHPVIRWVGETALSADDLNAANSTLDPEERSAAKDRAEWLREVLADGAVESKELFKLGRESGHHERNLRRTAKALGVCVRREGSGKAHRSFWELPGSFTPALRTSSLDEGRVSDVSEVPVAIPSAPLRTLHRDGEQVVQRLRVTAHGDRWFDEVETV